MISEKAAQGMVEAQANLQRLGGESLLTLKHLEAGTGFVSPGIIDVTSVSALPDEEYFGPLLQLIRYDDFDAAIDQGNATRYGLSAGLLGTRRRTGTTSSSGSAPVSSTGTSPSPVPPVPRRLVALAPLATTGRAPTTPQTTVRTRLPLSKTAKPLCRISCLLV